MNDQQEAIRARWEAMREKWHARYLEILASLPVIPEPDERESEQ